MNVPTHHQALYTAPPLTSEDEAALGEIQRMRKDLRHVLQDSATLGGRPAPLGARPTSAARSASRATRLRRTTQRRRSTGRIRSPPMRRRSSEIQGYRQALGYVLAMSQADYATFDTTELRAMHYMMLNHDLGKAPGRYRKDPIYVHDERSDKVVYEGPDAADVPELMEALVASLHGGVNSDPVIRSAIAHLNLVMIHPFGTGTGGWPAPWRPSCWPGPTSASLNSPVSRNVSARIPRTTTACSRKTGMARGSHGLTRICGWLSTSAPTTCRPRRWPAGHRGRGTGRTRHARRGTRSP